MGEVRDGQACFNLNAINGGSATAESTLPYNANVFKHLLMAVNVDEFDASQITDALRDWVDTDDELVSSLGAEDSWYQSLRVPYWRPMGRWSMLVNYVWFVASALAFIDVCSPLSALFPRRPKAPPSS